MPKIEEKMKKNDEKYRDIHVDFDFFD